MYATRRAVAYALGRRNAQASEPFDRRRAHSSLHELLGHGGFINDRRPYLEFQGNWRNPDIAMNDQGSIGRAFQSDGSVYRGHEGGRPYMPITFVQGSRSELDRECAAIRR
jgi:hypothetical protein